MKKQNKIIKPRNLEPFLAKLKLDFGDYIILRGYENLPSGYTNDIDVFVPKKNLKDFFMAIRNIEGFKTKIEILVSRIGLLKCELCIDDDVIPFDIMYGFYYFGLEYQNSIDLMKNLHIHESEYFKIPGLQDEIRISLLKELLHNSRVRDDKAEYLLKKLELCKAEIPNNILSKGEILFLTESIKKEKLYLFKFSQKLRLKLLMINLKNNFFESIKNILLFIYIKYVSKNNYHKRLIK